MHLDRHGLPVQANGDANDQLHRCGMIVAGTILRNLDVSDEQASIARRCYWAMKTVLQTDKPGVYRRFVGGDPANVSADQLISALAAMVVIRDFAEVAWLFVRTVLRLGFAQNYKDGLDDKKTRIKLPDFMAVRAAPLFARSSAFLYPAALVFDVLLLLAALAAVGPVWRDDRGPTRRRPDDCDDNNIILTLVVCREIMPTPLSRLALHIYAKYRPWNYGCQRETVAFGQEIVCETYYHPAIGALRLYHRAESGGNPEVAELWIPIVERWLKG